MEQKQIYIIIPARFASTRLPGKPLLKIAGKEMLLRVAEIAISICKKNVNCQYIIATDDKRVEDFCKTKNINVIMTSDKCSNGTERCLDALNRINNLPHLIINLQGDNPLCPPWVIQSLIDESMLSEADIYTPFVQLNWEEYDCFLETKKTTPYSGTTVLVDRNNLAIAFSKNIIPAIRNQKKAEEKNLKSPIRKHIGLYAYTYETLTNYHKIAESEYEKSYIEGLEQMRFLYNNLKIKMVEVDYKGRNVPSGVDSPEDVERVENNIRQFGEYIL